MQLCTNFVLVQGETKGVLPFEFGFSNMKTTALGKSKIAGYDTMAVCDNFVWGCFTKNRTRKNRQRQQTREALHGDFISARIKLSNSFSQELTGSFRPEWTRT